MGNSVFATRRGQEVPLIGPPGLPRNLCALGSQRRREEAGPGPSVAQGLLGDAVPSPLPPRSDAAERGSPGPGSPTGPAAQRHGGRHPHGSHLNPQHPIKFLLTHTPTPVTDVPQDWAGRDLGRHLCPCSHFSRLSWALGWVMPVCLGSESETVWCSWVLGETRRQAGSSRQHVLSERL